VNFAALEADPDPITPGELDDRACDNSANSQSLTGDPTRFTVVTVARWLRIVHGSDDSQTALGA
jgi:hypothetical protein